MQALRSLSPIFSMTAAQLVAAPRALEVSRGDEFQRVDLERGIGEQSL